MSTETTDPLLTADQVCNLLGGVSRTWLNDHAAGRRRPFIPCVQMGKVRRYRAEALRVFIEQCSALAEQQSRKARAA